MSFFCVFFLINKAFSGPRDAPRAALDPAADITDFYMFRSWERPENLVFIINVIPGQVPGDGPSYFLFSDDVKYQINIDNDMDGRANDITYEISFSTQDRPAFGELTFPLSYVGNPAIISRPELRGITALNGTGSEGITLRQTYKIFEKKGGKYKKRKLFRNQKLIAVPSNVGPVTMPDYEMLAAQGVYEDTYRGMRVFAGQRADSFYGDTGALFDGAAPRRFPPVLTPDEDGSNSINPFGTNNYKGRNVHSIAFEVPISRITNDRSGANHTIVPMIGAYASAHRKSKQFLSKRSYWNFSKYNRYKYKQVSRMGNPIVRSLIIDTPNKDLYNKVTPRSDAYFSQLYFDPPLARTPTSEIFGIPVPTPPRNDLVSLYLKYPGQEINGTGSCGNPCADLLRLNVSVEPTIPELQQRMGSLMATDPAGFPNGRRPGDDVIDFTVRAIGGPALIGARISDGVNFSEGLPGAGTEDGFGYGSELGNRLDVLPNGLVKEFPFLSTPHDGRGG